MNLFTKGLFFILISIFLLTGKARAQCSPPVYFGIMLHIEDDWNDDTDSSLFILHSIQMKNAVGYVKPYGAKITFECAIPFALGCTNWGNNVLQSLIDSSMGVGSHSNKSCDFNFTKALVDGLVGSSNNRGISGGTSITDSLNINNWVDSATIAGFSYKDGLVYSAYLQIPQNERPDSVSNTQIANGLAHNPAPKDFLTRIHPHRVSSGTTWHTDTTGPIMLLTGSLGGIAAVGDTACHPSCILDSTDVDSIVAYVSRAIMDAQTTGEFTVVYIFTQLNTYKIINKHIYDYLFESLDPFILSGNLEYKTMGEIYDEFLNCEIQSINNKEIVDDNKIKIFPNPCKNQFNIDVSKLDESVNSIEIFNITGQIVYKQTATRKTQGSIITINLPKHINGIVFVRINTEENIITKKMIIH
jgi:Secretion system C-terminal sorting domain